MIKQYYEKKLCICCETFKHFRNNCSYYSVQWFTTFIIIANTTTTALESTAHKLNVKKIKGLKKE